MSGRSDLDALQDLQARFVAFTNACAHDLRTPARNIGALCELLSEVSVGSVLSESDVALVDAVASESKRMTTILNGVVDYARVPVRVDGRQVDLEYLVRAHWVHSEADLTVDPLPTVSGDRTLLGRLVRELVSNVVRFSGTEPPKLHVFATRQDGVVELHFEDFGDGIPEGREHVVFAVLRRCHPEGGVGIGLATCERIVAAHNGSIRVVHGRTDGATVIVRLPDGEELA